MIRRILARLGVKQDYKNSWVKTSYSQCGEDLILEHLFREMKIERPTYLDIGAHHPTYLNNTYLLYLRGCRGINVEPDPHLIAGFMSKRSEDTNLNIGIGVESGEAEFYIMNEPTLNTFMKEEAERIAAENAGYSIVEKRRLPLRTTADIVKEYNKGVFPDFLSIDVEGLDETILRSINYDASTPKVVCVETLTFEPNGRGQKSIELIEFLKTKGYIVYADTYINTIFVKRSAWLT